MMANSAFLVAEDNENDTLLLSYAFQRAGVEIPLAFVRDGQEAIDALKEGQSANALPHLLLLDLHMPKYNGFEVLQWIREQPRLRRLIVIVLTSSPLPADINRAYDLGANSYLTKPMDNASLTELVKALHEYWVEANECPDCCRD